MKKIQSFFFALPLVVAAALVSCTDDNIDTPVPQPGQHNTVTFTASIPQTRVAYTINGNDPIKSTWDDDNDLNKTVVFEKALEYEVTENGVTTSVNGIIAYEFTIESIAEGVATLTYTGHATYPNNYTGEQSTDFPEPFTGTATYDYYYATEQVQTADNPTAHLNNGTKLVAKLSGVSSGSNIKFSHATSIYRVTFTAPENFSAGAKLRVNANGTDNLGGVTLNFPLVKNTSYTAYLHGDAHRDTKNLTYVLIHPDNDNAAHVCRKQVQLGSNGNPVNIEAGKYYGMNIGSEVWVEQDAAVADVIGDAPLDVRAVNIGIPLDENYQYVEITDGKVPSQYSEIKYYLYVAEDVLRDDDGNILYFYWGEREGHRRNTDGTAIQNAGETDFKYGCEADAYNNNTIKDEVILNRPTFTFYRDQAYQAWAKRAALKYLTLRIPSGQHRVEYQWELNSHEEVNNQDPRLATLVDEELHFTYDKVLGDAAAIKWGGNWRMMSHSEAKAFMKAVTSVTNNTTSGKATYTFNYWDNDMQKTGTISFPIAGACVKGDKTNGAYQGNFDLFFWTWLRTAYNPLHVSYNTEVPNEYTFHSRRKQIGEDKEKIDNMMTAYVLCSVFTTYDVYTNSQTTNVQNPVFWGLPILPALVVPKQTAR